MCRKTVLSVLPVIASTLLAIALFVADAIWKAEWHVQGSGEPHVASIPCADSESAYSKWESPLLVTADLRAGHAEVIPLNPIFRSNAKGIV
jgi:hypothetical protein